MEPKLNRVGGYTILRESGKKQVTHVQLAKGKADIKDESGIKSFDTSRSIADQISDQLRQANKLQQDEKK